MFEVKNFDTASFEKFDREFEKVFYDGDYKAMTSVYTEDAKIMVEDMDIIEGRSAIENFWKASCTGANKMNIKRTIHHDELDSSGYLAYKRGRVTLEVPLPDGKTVTHSIKYVTVWRREQDGTWRILLDISNRNAPKEKGQSAYGVPAENPAR